MLAQLNRMTNTNITNSRGIIDLVLEITNISGSDEGVCGYYFVDHRRKLLFWLDEMDLSEATKDVHTVISRSHLRK